MHVDMYRYVQTCISTCTDIYRHVERTQSNWVWKHRFAQKVQNLFVLRCDRALIFFVKYCSSARSRNLETYMNIYAYLYMYMYTYVYMYMYVYMYTYTYMYMCTYMYIYVYLYTYTYMHAYVYVHVYVYIFSRICIYMCRNAAAARRTNVVCASTAQITNFRVMGCNSSAHTSQQAALPATIQNLRPHNDSTYAASLE